jgi:hypothetical protein
VDGRGRSRGIDHVRYLQEVKCCVHSRFWIDCKFSKISQFLATIFDNRLKFWIDDDEHKKHILKMQLKYIREFSGQ